jgi:hypothetical protein
MPANSITRVFVVFFRYAQSIETVLEDEEQFADQLKEYYAFGDALRLFRVYCCS